MRSGRASFEVAVANGVLAGYRLDGEPPALILHGGPGLDHTYMDGFVDELEDIVAAISYQQRGLPPSSVGGPYSVRGHVDDAIRLLDGLSVGRAWMIGHSWGGFLAMAIAAWAPRRTLGWIAVEPAGLVGDAGMADLEAWLYGKMPPDERARAEALDAEEDAQEPVDAGVVWASMGAFWPYYFADPASAPPFRDLLGNPRLFTETIDDMLALAEGAALPAEVAKGGRPGVIVAGAESGLRRAAERTAEEIGCPFDVIERAAHFPWLEIPGSIREICRSRIRSAST